MENLELKNTEFNTLDEIFSVVIGVLAKDEGKIHLSKFNKIIYQLGLDRINQVELKDIISKIRKDPKLNKIKNDTIQGNYVLGDLSDVTGNKPFEGNNYFKAVSTYTLDNERALSSAREIKKVHKEGAYLGILMEDLKEELVENLLTFNEEPLIKRTVRDNDDDEHLIIGVSDWHVGAINTDYSNGGYNFDVLVKRMSTFIDEIGYTISTRGINNVTIFFVGDLVEHINMREVNQAFETEFTLAQQITKGQQLLLNLIKEVSSMVDGTVTFGMVAGNHDRLQGNKNQKVYNDSVAYIVLDNIIMLSELGFLTGVDIIDNRKDIYTIRHKVSGKNIVVNHGDMIKGKGKNITKFIENENIDILFTGHIHHLNVTQEDFKRLHIVVSSPMGYNNYAKELLLSKTSPSQQMVVLNNNTPHVELKTVYLD